MKTPEKVMSGGLEILAWAGWQVRVPEDWRPLRVEGGWWKGAIIVGSGEEAAMQIRWWRPEKGRLDAERWLKKRLASLAGCVAEDSRTPPGFSAAALLPDYTTRDGMSGVLWIGYSPTGGIALEIVAGGDASDRVVKTVRRRVIPSLRTYGVEEGTCWSIYGASFRSPPSFFMTDRRLLLGDIAVELSSGKGCRLVLRQVYPASLALARRKLPAWMDFPPFKEHRRFRASGPDEKWNITCFGRSLEGLMRRGQKRLPFPLGIVSSRWSCTAVVQDRELDRLLLAECDSRSSGPEEMLSQTISSMNWARLHSRG